MVSKWTRSATVTDKSNVRQTKYFSHVNSIAHRRCLVVHSCCFRGPPGSGKTSVGRELARLMNKSLLDIDDDWLEPRWKCSVASKLRELGDEQFLEAEGQQLMNIDHENHIISLTGSNPLHRSSMEHLS
jgi:shikimate kinase